MTGREMTRSRRNELSERQRAENRRKKKKKVKEPYMIFETIIKRKEKGVSNIFEKKINDVVGNYIRQLFLHGASNYRTRFRTYV